MLPETLADQSLELYFAWQLSDKPNAPINNQEKLEMIKKGLPYVPQTVNTLHFFRRILITG